MSEQKTKSLGQIAYEAVQVPSRDWFEISALERLRWGQIAQAVREAVIAEFTNIPQSAFTPALAEKIESQMHRDTSLSLPPQAAQVDQERRRMTPEERKAAGEYVIRQLSTPQRYPVLSAEQAKAQEAMRPMTPEERAAVGEFVIQQLSTPQRNK